MEFVAISKSKRSAQEVLPFLEWMRIEVMRPEYINAAQEVLETVGRIVPAFAESLHGPQSGLEHLEGPQLRDHVLRMLTVLHAIAEGVSLQSIEEYDSHPHAAIDLDLIAHLVTEQFATFLVFTLLHDYAKADTLRVTHIKNTSQITAPLELRMQKKSVLKDSDIELYQKMHRAVAADMGDVREEEVMAALYEKYGIILESPDHEKWFINDSSVAPFETIFDMYRLRPRDIQHIKFLVRYHEMVREVEGHRGSVALETLRHAAEAYGIDSADARDMLLVILFLNDICGKIAYEGGRIHARTELLLEFVRAEEMQFVEHRDRKRAAHVSRRRARVKEALQEVGLSVESLLKLCEIPFDASREIFVQTLYTYFLDADTLSLKDVLGAQSTQFTEQFELAKKHFDENP